MYLFLMSWDGLPFIIRDAIDQKVWLGYQKSLKISMYRRNDKDKDENESRWIV